MGKKKQKATQVSFREEIKRVNGQVVKVKVFSTPENNDKIITAGFSQGDFVGHIKKMHDYGNR